MKLTVVERLVLLSLLPQEGNFANLKLLRVARESLSFNEAENKKLGFIQDGDQVRWDETAARVIDDKGDFEFGEVVSQMIGKELKRLDEEEKLREEHVSLFEKFEC